MIRKLLFAIWSMVIVVGLCLAGDSVCSVPMCETVVDDYLRLVSNLRRRVLTLDSHPHDPAAVLVQVGRQANALARAVDDGIRWHPEAGVVRGAAGTLSAGVGGDWDRAVLVSAVLQEAGHATRFAVVTRSDDERRRVVQGFLAEEDLLLPSLFDPAADAGLEDDDAALLEHYGVSARNHERQMIEASLAWQRLLDEAYDSGERLADFVLESARTPHEGNVVEFDHDLWQRRLSRAAGEAVAVEVRTDTGWELLPLGPDGDVIDWRAARRSSEVPAARMAQLSVTVTMTVAAEDGDQRQDEKLFHKTIELPDLFTRPMMLQVVPAADSGSDQPGSWTAREWYEHVRDFQRFQVVFHVGNMVSSSSVFDRSGRLFRVGQDGRIAGAESLGGGMMAAFTGLTSEAAEDDGEIAGTRLEALTLTLRMNRPGMPEQRQERIIYGPLRPGVSPVFHAHLLASGGPVGPSSVLWMTLDAATANAPLVAQVLTARDASQYPQHGETRLPSLLHDWLLGRADLVERQLRHDEDLILLTGPTVVMNATQIISDDDRQHVRARRVVDVVWDQSVMGPRNSSGGAQALRANIAAGIAATALEVVLLREVAPPVTTITPLTPAGLLRAAAAPPEDPPQPSALSRWSLERNEEDRSVVFAGVEEVDAWWSIDPATGAALGRGHGGEGQAAAEYGNIQRQNLNNLQCFLETLGGGSGGAYVACVSGVDSHAGRMGAAAGIRKQFGGFGNQAKLFSHLSRANTVLTGLDRAAGGGR